MTFFDLQFDSVINSCFVKLKVSVAFKDSNPIHKYLSVFNKKKKYSDEEVRASIEQGGAYENCVLHWFFKSSKNHIESKIGPMLKSKEDFKDVYQEACIDFWNKSLSRFRGGSTLLSYFEKICRYKAIDFLRKKKVNGHKLNGIEHNGVKLLSQPKIEEQIITTEELGILEKQIRKIVGNHK